MSIPKTVLPIIIFSQFCCTSLWFAGNAVIGDLLANFNLSSSALGHLTSAVQFGFISGTLLFALFSIADRFAPSKVFFTCAVLGAVFNIGTIWTGNTLSTLLIFRFFVGFCLAGIYPVGMKIAADYFDKGLGKSLGYLVGALVLGTAFPHLLKGYGHQLPWKQVLMITSSIAVLGGVLMVFFVPNGPHRKASQQLDLKATFKVFENSEFKSAAFGYFGHMWELYAFWAFVPVMLSAYNNFHSQNLNVPILSFVIIALGGLACVAGGYISAKAGPKKVAHNALLLSGICCLLSPLIFLINSPIMVVGFLIFWGLVVIADSPMFSTLVAMNAEAQYKGTALTIVNCIGFAITIVSIQLLNSLMEIADQKYIYLILALGPIFGLISLRRKVPNPS